MRCYVCARRSDHLIRRRRDVNYITNPVVALCWSCIRATRRK